MEKVLWSASESSRQGTHLLLMLHGYGSSEQALAKAFPALPPGVTGAALRGPLDVGDQYGWFLLDPLLNSTSSEVLESALSLLQRLDRLRAREEFSGVSVLGFSQGMAMAVAALRLRPKLFTAAVGLSGFIVEDDLLAGAEPLPDPVPFFWGRDRADWVIHTDAIVSSEQWLHKNTALTARTYPGMGHTIGQEELRDVGIFLRRYLLQNPAGKAAGA